MSEPFSFGYWLKRQRLARDLRQAALARQLGIAVITLRKIEADERRSSLQLIEQVATVFALNATERDTLLRVARADLDTLALPLPSRAHAVAFDGPHAPSATPATDELLAPSANSSPGTFTFRVAALLAAAHPGQTLLSLAAAELVRDRLPAEISLYDLGAHRLRDLTRPEQVFQLVAPDLPIDFPPLQSLEAQRHNLPVAPTSLLGRERELAAVGTLLRDTTVRMVTLTGSGGVGKTRLALQAAVDALGSFPEAALAAVRQAVTLAPEAGQPQRLLARLLCYTALPENLTTPCRESPAVLQSALQR